MSIFVQHRRHRVSRVVSRVLTHLITTPTERDECAAIARAITLHNGPLVPRFEITCPECDLTSVTTYTNELEAYLLRSIHNDLHHRGHPIALVRGVPEPGGAW